MTSNSNEDASGRAVDQLEALGLSVYAARTLVGLVTLGSGTAKEVSEVAEVPRTRVYDAAEELSERGLVTIDSSTPRRFHAVSIERAVAVLSSEHAARIDEVVAALEAVSSTESTVQRDDLWLLSDAETIVDHAEQFLDESDETLLFATARSTLDDRIADGLIDAAQRGVTMRIAGLPQRVVGQIEAASDTVECRDRPWDPSQTPFETVLIADEERALLVLETDDPLAVCSAGQPNNLLRLLGVLLDLR